MINIKINKDFSYIYKYNADKSIIERKKDTIVAVDTEEFAFLSTSRFAHGDYYTVVAIKQEEKQPKTQEKQPKSKKQNV